MLGTEGCQKGAAPSSGPPLTKERGRFLFQNRPLLPAPNRIRRSDYVIPKPGLRSQNRIVTVAVMDFAGVGDLPCLPPPLLAARAGVAIRPESANAESARMT